MHVISTETREEAWLQAVKHLKNCTSHKIEYNLILEVKKPALTNVRTKNIRDKFDSFAQTYLPYNSHTVAETIFPASLYKKYGSEGVYTVYPEQIYPTIKGIQSNNRGTYAMRIVRATSAVGKEINPLKEVVSRLKTAAKSSSGIRCAHEISIDDSESIPINKNDRNRYGFPCLSHLSFKLSYDRKELHLTAVYRSQFFIEKAMGNLLGLARLQSFLCREVGVDMGALVCHATYAKLDDSGKVQPFNKLLKSLEE
ncbi:hypothetical protein [Pseudoalteromonas sp. JC3]|uniref:hypothetical protein n=1 Tax=Pseudoalteromonas sp. JC3 TaxID=2810196 RepID=UPI0019D1E5A8|nr:hypothetical protein [Pseudoalteromonas sp. JC3]MBR8843167.1 hypothetical protein [Pseudoalteromonas sp. JC3]WJE09285.1 hypothetical protein QSH61_02110 [Pseudoalteromonas sp. JC3]